MEIEETPLEPPEHVLSTLNPDGTRRWLAPRLAKGRFWKRRRVVAYGLILLFNLLPWIQIGGKPAMLLDVMHREFTFFGMTFQPTETLLITLLILAIFVGIFLATALFGRVWCGWGCPQTVYLEYLYRPIERLVEGKHHSKGRAAVPGGRKLLKYAVFLVISLHLSHTFLAYFVGAPTVIEWSLGNPADHMTGFLIVWLVAAAMMIDFGFFREQMCILACPYGRLQSALLDPDSIVIGYDPIRGEPRGKGKRGTEKTTGLGDCVDCKLCVAVCPTGIDIRDGLQMECVNCAECVDACDSVMDRIGRPRGLIRYASETQLAGGRRRSLRPRTALYGLLLIVVLAGFGFSLNKRAQTHITALRAKGMPYVLENDGIVMNRVQLRIENRMDHEREFKMSHDVPELVLLPEVVQFEVDERETIEVTFLARLPRSHFTGGRCDVRLGFTDEQGRIVWLTKTLLGPSAR